ncbi:hypothetical protein HC256_003157 [Beauveria bassiana]|nr:hypothetical protein HC256_003157 [Beauveria bassiana]
MADRDHSQLVTSLSHHSNRSTFDTLDKQLHMLTVFSHCKTRQRSGLFNKTAWTAGRVGFRRYLPQAYLPFCLWDQLAKQEALEPSVFSSGVRTPQNRRGGTGSFKLYRIAAHHLEPCHSAAIQQPWRHDATNTVKMAEFGKTCLAQLQGYRCECCLRV